MMPRSHTMLRLNRSTTGGVRTTVARRHPPDRQRTRASRTGSSVRCQVHQSEQRQVQSTAQRVGAFLLRFCPPGPGNATFELPFDKSLIARRLGMKAETFSRALARLRGIGVETHGATVSVDDLDRLRAYCEEGGDEGA